MLGALLPRSWTSDSQTTAQNWVNTYRGWNEFVWWGTPPGMNVDSSNCNNITVSWHKKSTLWKESTFKRNLARCAMFFWKQVIGFEMVWICKQNDIISHFFTLASHFQLFQMICLQILHEGIFYLIFVTFNWFVGNTFPVAWPYSILQTSITPVPQKTLDKVPQT